MYSIFNNKYCFFFKGYKRRDTNKIIPINYKERKRKDENRSLTISVIGIIISCLGLILTVLFAIPSPNIYPLDNEAKVYNGTIEVYMDSYPLITTYYTLDGSDPKNGSVYEAPLTISETTTISAKNKFLFGGWSVLSQRTYRFENIPITYSGELDLLISDKLPSADELLEYALTIIIILAIIWCIIRNGLRKIRDRIRNFFDF